MPVSKRSCASAFCSVGLAVAACSKPAGQADSSPATAATSASISVAPVADRAQPERRVDPDEPVAAKSIGHTSYVLKVTLAGGAVGVFKPRSRRYLGDRRYRGEIAAYRLGAALGLDNVPRATPRAFDAAALRAACGSTPGNAERFDREALVDPDGKLRGAFIDWIDDYRELPLENADWRARWEPWLMNPATQVPKVDLGLASAISTMIAFDYLTGNWDRWSGGNVARAGTGALLYVDNDGAFYERPPSDALEHQLGVLRRVVRFSRRFVDALRALDPPKLAAAIGDEEPGAPLLPPSVLAGVEERGRAILQLVDSRVARLGERAALAFE